MQTDGQTGLQMIGGPWADRWAYRQAASSDRAAVLLKRLLEAELAACLNFQFSAPVLGPGRRPGSRAFMGSFPLREEQATTVNSLIPTACPGLSHPTCLGTWHLPPRGSQDSRTQTCPVPSPGSTTEGQGGCMGTPPPTSLVGLRPARFPQHPQSQRTLRMSGAQTWG